MTTSSYLISNNNRYIIKACVDNPILWKTIRPNWFDDEIAIALAWASIKHYRENSWDPTLDNLIQHLDFKKLKASEDDIVDYIDIRPIDTPTKLKLFTYFKCYGMLVEPIFDHHLTDRKMTLEQLERFKALSNEFRSMFTYPEDWSDLDSFYQKIKYEYNGLQNYQRQLR